MHKPVTFTASPHTKYASLLPNKKKEVKIKLIFAPTVFLREGERGTINLHMHHGSWKPPPSPLLV
jgi:hypothetical protein